MATTLSRAGVVHTVGDLPAVGTVAPDASFTGTDLVDFTLDAYAGKRVVLNIFPSIDTGVCATSVRTFNALAADLENTVVVCISHDLPYALKRFCGAEGIENVAVASGFRTNVGTAFGVLMLDGAMRGLLARAVVVLDADRRVLHAQLTESIGQEPDYDAALAALTVSAS